jgi:ketopantoate hydroxymethyltransferase
MIFLFFRLLEQRKEKSVAKKKSVQDFIQMKQCGHCAGQVLTISDMLGAFEPFTPKFVKRYANVGEIMVKALSEYIAGVKAEKFPEEKRTYRRPP